ncbi:hypothetical protein [Paracoccus aminophilus]|uniref:Lipoprotein n=1 Tax=Paracoccus aminophilus JCM 7686 TaxID=1367847 RepID=S5XXB5_PARAH|nr:hypothetical protein [Paracoccus aminophilus]AGT09957.1 hypothetical protein JCM7686_2901 [Paracoccus aminophilus JCM 7686]
MLQSAARALTPIRVRFPLLASLLLAGPALAESPATCPEPEFDAFLSRFSREIAVQEASTADPLVIEILDPEADPEPKLERTETPLAKVEWPVMTDVQGADANDQEVLVKDLDGGGKEVVFRGLGNGTLITYEFRAQPCWTLVRYSDESM